MTDAKFTNTGRVPDDAVTASGLDVAGFDAYVVGPRLTIADCLSSLAALGVDRTRIFAGSYGT